MEVWSGCHSGWIRSGRLAGEIPETSGAQRQPDDDTRRPAAEIRVRRAALGPEVTRRDGTSSPGTLILDERRGRPDLRAAKRRQGLKDDQNASGIPPQVPELVVGAGDDASTNSPLTRNQTGETTGSPSWRRSTRTAGDGASNSERIDPERPRASPVKRSRDGSRFGPQGSTATRISQETRWAAR
jgi:hypothetical protein